MNRPGELTEDDLAELALWDWSAISAAEVHARRRVEAMPSCYVCGGKLTCGQRGQHHSCDPDWLAEHGPGAQRPPA